jgi:hypothetical protein
VHTCEDLERYFNLILEQNEYSTPEDRIQLSKSLGDNAKGSFLYGFIIAEKVEKYSGVGDRKLNLCLSLPFEPILDHDLQSIPSEDVDLFWNVVKLSMVWMKPLDCVIIIGLTNCTDGQLNRMLSHTHSFFHLVHQRLLFLHKMVKNFLLRKLGGSIIDRRSLSRKGQCRRLSFCGSSEKDVLSLTQEAISL